MHRAPAETPAAHPPPARRYLLSTAVPDVAAHPEAQRSELADDLRRIDALFLGELGYRKGADLGLNPTREQLTKALRAFATAPDRAPDDYVVLYIAAHGITADYDHRHHLLLTDSDARRPRDTALPTDALVAEVWEDTAIERLLVLVDACYAEEGTDKALRGALEARRFRDPVTEHGSTGLVLVASSRRKEESYAGALSAAFDRAVRREATAGHTPAHISIEHVMAAIGADPEVPPAQRPVWSLTHATAGIPAFLPNPRHVPDAAGLKLDEIDRIVALGSRERLAREQELLGFFLPRARGTDVPTEEVWDFTGRHAALTELTAWLAPHRAAERLCVVTGDPGSGKSSLLGMVAVLCDPERGAAVPRAGLPPTLPEPGAIGVAVNASHKSTRQLLDALSAAAGGAAGSLGALAAQLQTRTGPLVVLIDSLDEALAPQEVVQELIAPLTDPERRLPLRLLVGARPHIARRLPASAHRVDLDDERYADPAAVRAYTRALLTTPGSALVRAEPRRVDAIADAVAEAAGRSFLVARITARTLAREPQVPDPADQRWRDELPRLPGEAMERDLDQRLGPLAGQARDLLLPLAHAQGGGLPWAGIWPRLATALSGRDYGDEHIVWLRQAAGSYVVESVESDGSVYRVYHRALIEYLREGRDPAQVQRAVTRTLRGLDHPYVRRYLALHAGEGGVLDPLVQDAAFVLAADPGQLFAALPRLTTAEGRRAGHALRDSEELLRDHAGRGPDPEARAALRLAAVCRRARALADSCDTGAGELPWRARWAAWNPHEGARRYTGLNCRTGWGVVVPGAPGQGAGYLEMTPWRGDRAWWDLETGEWEAAGGYPDEPHGETWTAPPQLPSRAAVLSHGLLMRPQGTWQLHWRHHVRLLHLWTQGGGDPAVWMLPPAEGLDVEPERRPLRAAEQVVVLADDAGRPATALLRFAGGDLLAYQLGTARVYQPLTRQQRRPMGQDSIEQWQGLKDRYAAYLSRRDRDVTACAAPQGLPVGHALAGHGDGSVRVLSFGGAPAPETRTTTGHEGAVTLVDLVTGHPQGRLLVTAGEDATVRVSSPAAGEPVRTLLSGDGPIAALAVRRAGRQWIVAVATTTGHLHRVDLDSGRPVGLPTRIERSKDVRIAVFDLGAVACVSVQGDARGLQLYDLVTGDRVGGQVQSHEAAAVCTVGATVCVGGTDGVIRLWPTAQAADSVQLHAHDGPVLALGTIRGPGGRSALVSVGRDYEIRCWDPVRCHELWRRTVLDPGVWTVELLGCATVAPAGGDRDLVVTGEYGGRVRVLVLRHGLPAAAQEFTLPEPVTAVTTGRVRGRSVVVAATATGRVACWDVDADRMYALGPTPGDPVFGGPAGGGRAQGGPGLGGPVPGGLADGGPVPGGPVPGGPAPNGAVPGGPVPNAPAPNAPAPGSPAWTTALALDPDGSGRLVCGARDGTLREWSLPGCRRTGPVRAVHQGPVQALALVPGPAGTRLLSAGAEHVLSSGPDGWRSHRPAPVRSFHVTGTGVLCGDGTGRVWRLTDSGGGWRVTEALDAVRPVSALTTLTAHGRTRVVTGSMAGSVQVRDADHGELARDLRPLCDSGVEDLHTVAWRSPGRAPRPLLFTRSRRGQLEYWDFGAGEPPGVLGSPLTSPVPHADTGRVRTVDAADATDGAQSLLLLDIWNAAQIKRLWNYAKRRWDDVYDLRLAVHDVAHGPLPDQWCAPPRGRVEPFDELFAVRCAGRLLVVMTVRGEPARLLDVATGRWTTLASSTVVDVFALPGRDAGELLVLDDYFAWIYPLEELLSHARAPGDRPPRHTVLLRRLLRRPPGPVASDVHVMDVRRARFAALLPGGEAYVTAGGVHLAVAAVRGGASQRYVRLPARCTALTVGPAGEIVVGTRNGPILFD
ncbi:caspase family protein [Streptomyces sp. NPDC049813]|uniref:nSTAND1 domain-containing NTPase n=1 Tax=Streptomyces sp. NPDC049813 TaxID=3365597 RepID=UPI0037B7726A